MTSEKTKESQESRDGCAERERTAATLLAALIRADAACHAANSGDMSFRVDEGFYTKRAVALADALRAALRGAP